MLPATELASGAIVTVGLTAVPANPDSTFGVAEA
jgi:hypothetical protein